MLSAGFVDKIGYRISMVAAHVSSALGIVILMILPEPLPSSFIGILIAVMIYAIGGGLLEVLVSPVVEACPSDNKEKAMRMLHSFYCWGHVGVVLISTAFTKVPIASLLEEGETGYGMKDLFGMKIFWILMIMMICARASEQAVS